MGGCVEWMNEWRMNEKEPTKIFWYRNSLNKLRQNYGEHEKVLKLLDL